jgi:hypothetical protein
MSSKVAQAIAALRQAAPRACVITLEAAEEYQLLNGSYLYQFESEISPACIFLLKSKEDVVAFVSTIKPFIGDVQFAIRAAG